MVYDNEKLQLKMILEGVRGLRQDYVERLDGTTAGWTSSHLLMIGNRVKQLQEFEIQILEWLRT